MNRIKPLCLYLSVKWEEYQTIFTLTSHISRASFCLPATDGCLGHFTSIHSIADPLIENIECWEGVIPVWSFWSRMFEGNAGPFQPLLQQLIPRSLWKPSGLHSWDGGQGCVPAITHPWQDFCRCFHASIHMGQHNILTCCCVPFHVVSMFVLAVVCKMVSIRSRYN